VNATHFAIPTAILLVIFLISSILYGTSFGIVPPTSVGLNFDSTTKNYDSTTIYPPGRYFIWMNHFFELFPVTYQEVDFSTESGSTPLSAVTDGGQVVTLDVSFFYRIDETKVPEIYSRTRNNLNGLIVGEATNSLKITASAYDVEDFFSLRREIAARMLLELNTNLYTKYHVWVPMLQLRNIVLPTNVQNSRTNLIIASQNTKTAELARQIVLIQEETAVLRESYSQNQTIILNTANSDSFTIEQNAIAEGNRLIAQTVAEAQRNFTESVGFTNTSHFMTYLFIKMLRSAPSANSFIVGFDGAVPIIIG